MPAEVLVPAPISRELPKRLHSVATSDEASAHASREVTEEKAKRAFEEALVRIEQASSEVADDEDCAELARGLVTGHWSQVQQFERNGRRYFLVHHVEPEADLSPALTRREREVLGFAELGQSNKFIAYSLGLSISTVATLLVRARKKVSSVPPPTSTAEETEIFANVTKRPRRG